MNKTYKRASLLGILGLTAVSIASVSAMSFGPTASPDEIATRQTTVFQEQASLIGVSVDEVKTVWAQGKDLKTLAAEKGITADQLKTKMQTSRLEQMKATLATLVTKGVITQAQADSRIAYMSTQTTTKGKGRHGHGGERMMGLE
jgi:hypothetical protein